MSIAGNNASCFNLMVALQTPIVDFHHLAICHARHTHKKKGARDFRVHPLYDNKNRTELILNNKIIRIHF